MNNFIFDRTAKVRVIAHNGLLKLSPNKHTES